MKGEEAAEKRGKRGRAGVGTRPKFKVQTDVIIEKATERPDGYSPGSTCTERCPRGQSAWRVPGPRPGTYRKGFLRLLSLGGRSDYDLHFTEGKRTGVESLTGQASAASNLLGSVLGPGDRESG